MLSLGGPATKENGLFYLLSEIEKGGVGQTRTVPQISIISACKVLDTHTHTQTLACVRRVTPNVILKGQWFLKSENPEAGKANPLNGTCAP